MTPAPSHPALARRIEDHFFKAWPAMAEMNLDGWHVRLAGGYSDRANSVTPLSLGTQAVADKLSWCERFYNDRRLPVIFRISDLCPEPDFDAQLHKRGYKMSWMLETASCDLTANRPTKTDHVLLEDRPSSVWLDAALAVDSRIAMNFTPFAFITDHLPKPACFARIEVAGRPVAVGAATCAGDLMAIFLMRTKAEARRRGHARAVLDALMTWGAAARAKTAWLQFDRDAEPLQKLYRGAGFTPVYNYHYRKQSTLRD
jgi:N-acetylglutamate synthase